MNKLLSVLHHGGFDETKHPRGNKGTSKGGQFVSKDDAPESVHEFERNFYLAPMELGHLVGGDGRVANVSGGQNHIGPQEFAPYVKMARGGVLTHVHPQQAADMVMEHGLSISDMRMAAYLELREIRAVDREFIYSFRLGNKNRTDFDSAAVMADTIKSKHYDEGMARGENQSAVMDKASTEAATTLAAYSGGQYKIYDRSTGRVVYEFPAK